MTAPRAESIRLAHWIWRGIDWRDVSHIAGDHGTDDVRVYFRDGRPRRRINCNPGEGTYRGAATMLRRAQRCIDTRETTTTEATT